MAKDRKRSKAKERRAPDDAPIVAETGGPAWLRPLLTAAACLYLFTTFLNGARTGAPDRLLPPTLRYFIQTTCLFPRAATMTIDYRLEGYTCDGRKFVELDPKPYFPVSADDKESRFYRVVQFHRKTRSVMQALERYVLDHEKASRAHGPLGGIRVSSLRIPIPKLGEPLPRWNPGPLASYPPDQQKHWFYTPNSRRRTLCGGPARPDEDKDEDPIPRKPHDDEHEEEP